MHDVFRQAAGYTCALLVYAALSDKIAKTVNCMTARGDVYDKGFADGFDRALAEGASAKLRAVPTQSGRS